MDEFCSRMPEAGATDKFQKENTVLHHGIWGCGMLELMVLPDLSWHKTQVARVLRASFLCLVLTPLFFLSRYPLRSAAVQWAAF